MESTDQILKTLVDADMHRGIFFSLKPVMERRHPELSQAKIAKISAHLEVEGFIETSKRKTKNVPHFVKLKPAAYAYFKNKEERRSMAELARTKATERTINAVAVPVPKIWDMSTVMIAYGAGLISGILLMWIKLS